MPNQGANTTDAVMLNIEGTWKCSCRGSADIRPLIYPIGNFKIAKRGSGCNRVAGGQGCDGAMTDLDGEKAWERPMPRMHAAHPPDILWSLQPHTPALHRALQGT